jgi:imidazole glycerol-phosphate synthase subunit HisF
VWTANGSNDTGRDVATWVEHVCAHGAGELLFQSISQDGTGMGLDLCVVDDLPRLPAVPCILMGGVGKPAHIIDGLQRPSVDAVATANLFNFIGSSFLTTRTSIAAAGIDVPQWDAADYEVLKLRFGSAA